MCVCVCVCVCVCSEYEAVKMAVLKNFELVPEAYRQKFWDKKKEDGLSYAEFLRDKEGLLDKWCSAKMSEGTLKS